jgi:hypothetical protein
VIFNTDGAWIYVKCYINVRENRRGNKIRTIQRNWQREIETGFIESVPNLCSNYGVILNANAF